MKKLNDEEIQKLLEQKLTGPGNEPVEDSREDINAYQLLFEALEKEPAEGLPFNFSKKVADKVQAATDRRQERKWYAYIVLIIAAAVAGIGGFMAVFNYKATSQVATIIGQYKWVMLFALLSVLVIQYVDRNLVKKGKGVV